MLGGGIMTVERIIAFQERLRLSKEKRECEKLKNTLLCPNCRHPTRHIANGNINESQIHSKHFLFINLRDGIFFK